MRLTENKIWLYDCIYIHETVHTDWWNQALMFLHKEILRWNVCFTTITGKSPSAVTVAKDFCLIGNIGEDWLARGQIVEKNENGRRQCLGEWMIRPRFTAPKKKVFCISHFLEKKKGGGSCFFQNQTLLLLKTKYFHINIKILIHYDWSNNLFFVIVLGKELWTR